MQQLLGIVFVLALLWGAVWFLRRKGMAVLNAPILSRKPAPSLQQIDRLRLTPQHSIHLLQVEDRRLLIAVHTQGVTILEQGSGRTVQSAFAGGEQ